MQNIDTPMHGSGHNKIVPSTGLVRFENRPWQADLGTWTKALFLYSSVIPESGFCDTLVEEEAMPMRVFRMQSPGNVLHGYHTSPGPLLCSFLHSLHR
jgi:hypothetical protein